MTAPAQVDYLQSLLTGQVPSVRPQFDQDIEKYIKQLETLASKGNARSVEKTWEGLLLRCKVDEHLAKLKAMDALLKERKQRQSTAETATAEVTRAESLMPPLPEWAQLSSRPLQQVSPWLAEYVQYSQKVSPEGHEDFHLPCGLWACSTVAARRIYVLLSGNFFYTPLAITMVARTSLFAKTTTANAALRVLRAANLGWLLGADETTPQKLLADMSGAIPANYAEMDSVQQAQIEQRVAMSGQLGWYYDEFNQLINAMTRPGPMAEFAGLLRKLDNCPPTHSYNTRSHGKELIEKPYLAFLGSTTPANLKAHASKHGEFWNDGFWARFAFLCPPPDSWKTSTMQKGSVPIPQNLVDRLVKWSQSLGIPECVIDEIKNEKGKGTGRFIANRQSLPETFVDIADDAHAAYGRYREALRPLTASLHTDDLDGSYSRNADKALRIAAIIASLEGYECITMDVWALAQEIAEMLRRNLHQLYAQVNSAQEGNPLEDQLIEHLKTLGGKSTTVRDILREASSEIRKLKADTVRDLLVSLERSGVVEMQRAGRKECWKLVG